MSTLNRQKFAEEFLGPRLDEKTVEALNRLIERGETKALIVFGINSDSRAEDPTDFFGVTVDLAPHISPDENNVGRLSPDSMWGKICPGPGRLNDLSGALVEKVICCDDAEEVKAFVFVTDGSFDGGEEEDFSVNITRADVEPYLD